MSVPTQPPGWYPDPGNPRQQIYWDGYRWQPNYHTPAPPPAARSKRKWLILIALLVVLFIAAVGVGGVLLHNVLSSKGTGGELVLSGATDPGDNPFMPPAASPPPTDTQPPPTLQPQGDGTTVATQPLPGDRDGLYGGTVNNADGRETIVNFLGANPAQAGEFVDALNTDSTVFWSGGRALTVDDIPAYLRELTPVLLRLDLRVTNYGFDRAHLRTLQSVLQAGTAVLVDAHGVPRVRFYSGSPLTAPIALAGAPKFVGTPWPGYRPGALAEVHPSTATITKFVLVDVVTGRPFNRPAGTTGTNDTPHTQAVPPPQGAPATPTTAQGPFSDIGGTYLKHFLSWVCNGATASPPDSTFTLTHQGNTVSFGGGVTVTLNADGSFEYTDQYGMVTQGVFATEGGHTVIHGKHIYKNPLGGKCESTWIATKQ
jgi:hypothetical protein